jgi:hypothetical protein
MRQIPREETRVGRIASPWLTSRFVDRNAEFLFAPTEEVQTVERYEQAIPFDSPGVELTHCKEACERSSSFNANAGRYKLRNGSLKVLAKERGTY